MTISEPLTPANDNEKKELSSSDNSQDDKGFYDDSGERLLAYRSSRFTFSGPLPPPEILAGYENIEKGLASRIVSMAERQSQHRQKLEETVINSDVNNEKMGMFFGVILTAFVVLVGAVLIYFQPSNHIGYVAIVSVLGFQGFNYYKYLSSKKPDKETASDQQDSQ